MCGPLHFLFQKIRFYFYQPAIVFKLEDELRYFVSVIHFRGFLVIREINAITS